MIDADRLEHFLRWHLKRHPRWFVPQLREALREILGPDPEAEPGAFRAVWADRSRPEHADAVHLERLGATRLLCGRSHVEVFEGDLHRSDSTALATCAPCARELHRIGVQLP